MAGNGKVVINLATALEDAERVTGCLPRRRRRRRAGMTVTMFLDDRDGKRQKEDL